MAKQKIYEHVFPNLEDWPIYKLHQDRKAFVKEVEEHTLRRLMRGSTKKVTDQIAKTVYNERIRIKEEPWKVDPPNDEQFWKRIRSKLVRKSLDREEADARLENEKILQTILHRYAEEIVATFRIPTFQFARKFLTAFFNRMLNTAAGRNLGRVLGGKRRLYERLKVEGEVDTVRELFKKGTVVFVPTHFSNLDSLLIGYALDTIAGIPFSSFGAGLNLFNTGYTAYFMNRLGVYRIDRRKKNPIYLETLKANSNLAIQRGTNSLFFPGGTRSRSGALETKLKLGMLGTAVEAQRSMFQQEKDKKVFIVPMIIGYHYVLESKSLIEQHLRRTGKENYLPVRDESTSFRKLSRFFWSLFSASNDIILSVGKPMDVLGNFVDADGISYDQHQNPIDVKEYFMSNGEVNTNLQREQQYTQILGKHIVTAFHRDNIVLSSHLIAYTCFKILEKQNTNLDLYGLLRVPTEDYVFPRETVRQTVQRLQEALLKMEAEDKIKLSETVRGDIDSIIEDGIYRLSNFQGEKPLKILDNGDIMSESFKQLFFYHNRLENYGLDKKISWRKKYKVEQVVAAEEDE
ncbi:MAG: 1-acyl-sn-glycerol-3-phosphate acyltransferase [Saprospiraceae bacterium]